MKKRTYYFLLIFLFACTALFVTACGSTAYIKVTGLSTVYYVGDTLDLTTAKLRYYENKETYTYTEADVTNDMISGFSTQTTGTFTMTITFNNASKDIEYVVKSEAERPVAITQTEAEAVIADTIANVTNFAEIKEETDPVIGLSSYTITTQNKQYTYQSQDSISWIIKENEDWKFYQIQYDVFDDVVEHTEYDLIMDGENLLAVQYGSLINGYIADIVFVEAYKVGNAYVITYNIPDILDMDFIMTIENNQLKTAETYISDVNGKTSHFATTTYTYYTQETNTIPEVADIDWEYGGYYHKI